MSARPCAHFPQTVVFLTRLSCPNLSCMHNKCPFFVQNFVPVYFLFEVPRKGVPICFLIQIPLKGANWHKPEVTHPPPGNQHLGFWEGGGVLSMKTGLLLVDRKGNFYIHKRCLLVTGLTESQLLFTVKPVFKGHSDEGTPCDQGTFSHPWVSRNLS